MKTWYPGIDDEEEMSDPECVESMSVSPYVSDIERENRVSGEANGRSDSSSATLLVTETSSPSSSVKATCRKKKYKKYVDNIPTNSIPDSLF